ncbi:hypothetical protein, partial [Okeania sp. SIO2G4]|uniref:hypothetical protein n=1 Tax=Okeania sp. SIO2G4 TaxID=2607793 RepID=UPI00257E18F7
VQTDQQKCSRKEELTRIMYRTPDRIFINLARSQETGDRRQETGGKREDVGRNNTKSKESGDRR